MLRGLYESAQGMIARQALQDVIANNLANSNATGFQREIAALRSSAPAPRGAAGATADPGFAPQSVEVYSVRDAAFGVQRTTGNPHDIALDGPGYLVAATPDGPRLVRSASLVADRTGTLSLSTGPQVVGADGGPIKVTGPDWRIAEDGSVVDGAGKSLGRLKLVDAAGVTPAGGSLSAATRIADLPPGATRVRAGSLEHSNVEPVREMVDMIAGMRAYEAGQRSIQSQDQTLQSLFSLLQ